MQVVNIQIGLDWIYKLMIGLDCVSKKMDPCSTLIPARLTPSVSRLSCPLPTRFPAKIPKLRDPLCSENTQSTKPAQLSLRSLSVDSVASVACGRISDGCGRGNWLRGTGDEAADRREAVGGCRASKHAWNRPRRHPGRGKHAFQRDASELGPGTQAAAGSSAGTR